MNWHDEMDDELRRALRREQPPAGFAERVLQRAEAGGDPASSWWSGLMHAPAFRFVATAALVIILAAGTLEYRHHERERQAGEAAKQQLMLALRVTGSKLQYAQQKVNGISSQQYVNTTEEKMR